MAHLVNSHDTNDHFHGINDHFHGTNNHSYGTTYHPYGANDHICGTAQTMGGSTTWSRETVRFGDEFHLFPPPLPVCLKISSPAAGTTKRFSVLSMHLSYSALSV
ncbi:unnamed protein product [Rotaria socialis]|uniref:Uncharacterized protein n=1 Tax=Rotaria socialis TaxID=392032 RepID=A0A821JSR3_9BILA|nr:unnamed protein product [Rotaria socialis]CAF4726319.1 unnamed protein product [Rotaria socialis]CAF4847854.1 unnamed protein product [Rotaria socialis]